MSRSTSFVLSLSTAASLAIACSGNGLVPVAENGGKDSATDSRVSEGGGSPGCVGTAPACFGSDLASCCGQDPSGTATCDKGQWMCGAAGAPGCNGKSCLLVDGGGDSSGGCVGSAPNCFGNDLAMCCGRDPSGVAACQGGHWMCKSVAAPGCDGTTCGVAADGGSGGCSPACNPSTEVCVSHQTVGGGQPFPDDAGNCPPGTVHAGDRCAPPPTYSCAGYPSGCGSTLNCTCAATVCTGSYMCTSTGTDLVNCVFPAP